MTVSASGLLEVNGHDSCRLVVSVFVLEANTTTSRDLEEASRSSGTKKDLEWPHSNEHSHERFGTICVIEAPRGRNFTPDPLCKSPKRASKP